VDRLELVLKGHGFTVCGKTPVSNQGIRIRGFVSGVSYRGFRIRGFVSGYRFSDTVRPSTWDAPLGAGRRQNPLFPQPLQPCRNCRKTNTGFSRWGNVSFKPATIGNHLRLMCGSPV
jgi:hypothetical protein